MSSSFCLAKAPWPGLRLNLPDPITWGSLQAYGAVFLWKYFLYLVKIYLQHTVLTMLGKIQDLLSPVFRMFSIDIADKSGLLESGILNMASPVPIQNYYIQNSSSISFSDLFCRYVLYFLCETHVNMHI